MRLAYLTTHHLTNLTTSQSVPKRRHALALGGVGEAARAGGEVVAGVVGAGRAGDDAGDGGVAEDELRKNWLQLAQSTSAAHSGRALPRTWPKSAPLSKGWLTMTATPRSAQSGSRRASAARLAIE